MHKTAFGTKNSVHCAAENGLPLLGVALNVIKPEYDLEEIFERHGDDAVNLNLGVAGGTVLALQTVEDMQECSITKAKDMFTKWPGILPRQPGALCYKYSIFVRSICWMSHITITAWMGDAFPSFLDVP